MPWKHSSRTTKEEDNLFKRAEVYKKRWKWNKKKIKKRHKYAEFWVWSPKKKKK